MTRVLPFERKNNRRRRVRAKVVGSAERPRLAVSRSLKHISAQIIDDASGKSLVSVHDRELKPRTGTMVDVARATGELLARKALEKKVKLVVFDRAGLRYHGRIQAFAEGARSGGLSF